MMQIDGNAKYSEVAVLYEALTDNSKDAILESAMQHIRHYYDLTIGEFDRLTNSDWSWLIPTDKEPTLLQYVWVSNFAAFCEDFAKAVANLSIRPNADQQAAQKYCVKVSVHEGMLFFAREYFGLHSFAEADKVTLGEYLLAKKQTFNRDVYEREYALIQQNKLKR